MSNGRFVILINSYQYNPNLINNTTAASTQPLSSIDKSDCVEAMGKQFCNIGMVLIFRLLCECSPFGLLRVPWLVCVCFMCVVCCGCVLSLCLCWPVVVVSQLVPVLCCCVLC